MSAAEITALVATVGTGITTGLCFAFAAFIMKAFDRLGPTAAIRVMQSINSVILRSSAMVVWFGSALVGIAAAILAEERAIAIVAAALYVIGAILITGRGNVPLNEALDKVDPEAPDAPDRWSHYYRAWGRWNALRTVLMALATAGFALST